MCPTSAGSFTRRVRDSHLELSHHWNNILKQGAVAVKGNFLHLTQAVGKRCQLRRNRAQAVSPQCCCGIEIQQVTDHLEPSFPACTKLSTTEISKHPRFTTPGDSRNTSTPAMTAGRNAKHSRSHPVCNPFPNVGQPAGDSALIWPFEPETAMP